MQKVVGLLFSKDRAMQLDATIRSMFTHCQDIQEMDLKVLFSSSNVCNEGQYQELANTYKNVEFIREVDFESQVLNSMVGYEYVFFLVDDNIFVRDFLLKDIMESLASNQRALGFSLRLGKNTTYCYSLRQEQQLPEFISSDHGFLKFDWRLAHCDFGYPLEVSSSIFRVQDILNLLQAPFTNPNTLEAYFDQHKMAFYHKEYLLCNSYSCTFSNPINKVQNTYNNRNGERFYYSAANLMEMFTRGYRIQVEAYRGFIPNACHQEMKLTFKKITQDNSFPVIRLQTSSPKVSVIMPVYNGEKYIGQAIDSILRQTFDDFELLIIDDGSRDQSRTIIKSYYDPRIRFISNDTNLKLIATLNKGIHMAKGQYIARMDADDISLPERLARQVAFMDAHPRMGVCGTWVELFGTGEQSFWRFSTDENSVKCMLLFGCCIVHPSVMMRKSIFEKGLCYSEQYLHGEDYALWAQIAQQYEISNIPEILLEYRKSATQVSTKHAGQQLETTFKIQREQLQALGMEPTTEECYLHWQIGTSQFSPNLAFVDSALTWLKKLQVANSQVHYYPEPAFQNLLHVFWTGVCNQLIHAF